MSAEITENLGTPFPFLTRLRAFREDGVIDWEIQFIFEGPDRRYNSGVARVSSKNLDDLVETLGVAAKKASSLSGVPYEGTYREALGWITRGLRIGIEARGGQSVVTLNVRNSTNMEFSRKIRYENLKEAVEILIAAKERGRRMAQDLARTAQTATITSRSPRKSLPESAWQVMVWGEVIKRGDWPAPEVAGNRGTHFTSKEEAEKLARIVSTEGGWDPKYVEIVKVIPPWGSSHVVVEVTSLDYFTMLIPELVPDVLWQVVENGRVFRGGDWAFDDHYWTSLEDARVHAMERAREGRKEVKVIECRKSHATNRLTH